MSTSPDRIHAPELTGAIDWLNVPAPLTLKSLRGKVVLLDFWTYGCINCMHILPDLRRLEEKYRDELVVIGVHSAKFTNEREVGEHPADPRPLRHRSSGRQRRRVRDLASAYGARAWPTLVLIDPEGYVVATASGEGKGEAFDQAIAAVITSSTSRARSIARRSRSSPERERLKTVDAGVSRQGARRRSRRTGCSSPTRIIIASWWRRSTARDRETIGDRARSGRVDGTFEAARSIGRRGWRSTATRSTSPTPRTTSIRAVDLPSRTVTTIAGTGQQAQLGRAAAARRARRRSTRRGTCDVVGRLLFVAMAGAHQIWVIDLERPLVIAVRRVGPRSACRRRRRRRRRSRSRRAWRGTATTLYVADSESNIIRAIALPPVESGAHDRRRRPVRVRRRRRPRRRGAAPASARDRLAPAGGCSSPTPTTTRSRTLDPATGRRDARLPAHGCRGRRRWQAAAGDDSTSRAASARRRTRCTLRTRTTTRFAASTLSTAEVTTIGVSVLGSTYGPVKRHRVFLPAIGSHDMNTRCFFNAHNPAMRFRITLALGLATAAGIAQRLASRATPSSNS